MIVHRVVLKQYFAKKTKDKEERNKMQNVKETAANVAASAKSGTEKAKATAQEKAEKATAHDPLQKEMATEKKQERINEAELNKKEARTHNAAVKHGAQSHVHTGKTTSGAGGYTTGAPGTGQVSEGVVGSHSIGTNTGTGRTTARNTGVGGSDATGHSYT